VAGLAAAKARGRVGGRPKALAPGAVAWAKQLHGSGHSVIEVAQEVSCSRATVYRALARASQAPTMASRKRECPVLHSSAIWIPAEERFAAHFCYGAKAQCRGGKTPTKLELDAREAGKRGHSIRIVSGGLPGKMKHRFAPSV
jgi:hypothetical protein